MWKITVVWCASVLSEYDSTDSESGEARGSLGRFCQARKSVIEHSTFKSWPESTDSR
jgi:hypothetical protein